MLSRTRESNFQPEVQEIKYQLIPLQNCSETGEGFYPLLAWSNRVTVSVGMLQFIPDPNSKCPKINVGSATLSVYTSGSCEGQS